MKLRRIDIIGFKSFRAKTGLEIHDGITAIVGPNGCGKSNIVDAIRWALGSQSPRDLRGRAMDDVIFAGSERHRPTGFAEVSLTLENDGTDIPLEWKDHAEIRVTRRLFRTGESEYEINGARVRLRDIQHLFLGTGVGSREAYSIIEQGRIGFIVAARPEERRTIIEEAAGITRYKFQRDTARRRLDKTRENLVRVQDVIAEVNRQLGSLERQAKRAAKARELRDEQRELELRAAVERFETAEKRAHESLQELVGARELAQQSETALTAAEARLTAARLSLQQSEGEAAEAMELAYQARSRRDLLESNIQHHGRELERLEALISRLEEEAAALAQEAETSRVALAESRAAREVASQTLAHWSQERQHLAVTLEVARKAESEKAAAIEALETRLIREVKEAERLQAREAAARSEVSSLGERLAREEAAFAQSQALMSEAAERLAQAQEELGVAQARSAQAQAAWEAARQASRDGRETLERLEAEQRSAHSTLVGLQHRLSTAQGLLRRGESYSAGVRKVLAAMERGELTGVERPVVERLLVEPGQEGRLVAALGPYADALVVPDQAAARELADWAAARELGLSIVWGEVVALGESPGLRAGQQAPAAIARRLAALSAQDPFGADAPDGTVEDARTRVAPSLVRIGEVEAGVLALARVSAEISELQEQVARAQEVEAERSAAREAQVGHLETLKTVEVAARQELEHAQGALGKSRLEREEAAGRHARLERQQREGELGLQRLVDRQKELETQAQGAGEARAPLEASARELTQQIEQERAALPSLRERARELADQHGLAAVEVARAQEVAAGVAEAIARSEGNLGRLAGRDRSRQQENARAQEARQGLLEGAEADRQAHRAASAQADEADLRVAGAQAAVEERRTFALEQEAAMLSVRKGAAGAAEALRNRELAEERARVEAEHAAQAIRERLGLSTAAAVEQAGGQRLSGEDHKRLERLGRQLETLGPVNPAAEEEYDNARERSEFLSTQKADLEAAMADLETAIRKMDKTSRELFSETFVQINERFQELFPRLFKGGQGRLELTDPEDLLNTGVEIVAQPPGKRLQSITLLSGGEKALTAVALVFAVFELKPSPFCILDEVDAPLDEANVMRFAEMVREMSDRSQFLMITHNKRSMEVAGTLYGVTMEEAGVSKVVGVRLAGSSESVGPEMIEEVQ